MNAYEQLMEEVEKELKKQNHKVVKAAFFSGIQPCSKCNYPENYSLFSTYLGAYIGYKINMTRYARMDYWRHGEIIMEKTGTSYTNVRQELRYATNKSEDIRSSLDRIWPCEDCMKLYNPTNKHNLPPRSLPMRKGVLV